MNHLHRISIDIRYIIISIETNQSFSKRYRMHTLCVGNIPEVMDWFHVGFFSPSTVVATWPNAERTHTNCIHLKHSLNEYARKCLLFTYGISSNTTLRWHLRKTITKYEAETNRLFTFPLTIFFKWAFVLFMFHSFFPSSVVNILNIW